MREHSGYRLIQNAAGALVNVIGGRLGAAADGDDTCLWRQEGMHLVHVDGLVRLTPGPAEAAGACSLRLEGGVEVEGEPFRVVEGPKESPSRHLEELRDQGFTIVRNVMDHAAIACLKAGIRRARTERHAEESSHDGNFWIEDALSWSPEVLGASSHPVALWIMRQYLGGGDIHFCHQPVITTLKPADRLRGTFPDSGWHTDYPYHPERFPDDFWPERPVLGVQFNVCVDAFRAGNGATQYLPGSHLKGRHPLPELNTGGTRMGQGRHAKVRQWLAPAGAGLIYDARMWHRAPHELNTSGADRIAILNAVAPSFIRPMMDKSALGEAFRGSAVDRSLTDREREDIARLCCTPTRPTPPGMPRLNPGRRRVR